MLTFQSSPLATAANTPPTQSSCSTRRTFQSSSSQVITFDLRLNGTDEALDNFKPIRLPVELVEGAFDKFHIGFTCIKIANP